MDKKKDERGNVRYLWVLVGAYLLSLTYRQVSLIWSGEAAKPSEVAVCVVSGLVFAGVGAWVIWREWQAWRYAQAHKDDPETWGGVTEDSEASEGAELPEASADAETPEDSDAPETSGAEAVGETDGTRKGEAS